MAKDALSIDAAHKPFFTQCADTLFGPLAVYQGELERLKARTDQQTRMRNAKIGFGTNPPPLKIFTLRHPADPYIQKIPPFVTHAIYDAGDSPTKFSNNLTSVITPGTYIDSASKTIIGNPVYVTKY